MRNRLYALTRTNIVSARISDEEMENIERVMEATNMKASEIMRKAFHLLRQRYSEPGGKLRDIAGEMR